MGAGHRLVGEEGSVEVAQEGSVNLISISYITQKTSKPGYHTPDSVKYQSAMASDNLPRKVLIGVSFIIKTPSSV